MAERNAVVPSPAERLAMFRIDRLGSGVENIGARTRAFRSEVEAALSGGVRQVATTRALSSSFGAAYLALSEALDAARAGDVVRGPALDALAGIMGSLKEQYSNGIAELRSGVDRLNTSAPESFARFCLTAAEKIGKLEQFWQATYEHAPKYQLKM